MAVRRPPHLLTAVPIDVFDKFHESRHDVGQGAGERPKNNPQITAQVWVCACQAVPGIEHPIVVRLSGRLICSAIPTQATYPH